MTLETHASVSYIKDVVRSKIFTIRLYIYEVDGLLIDTGARRFEKKYTPYFADWQLKKVAITHFHEDHAGLAGWVEKNLGIPIYMHESSILRAQKSTFMLPYRRLFWGQVQPFVALPYAKELVTKHHTFTIVESPGHKDDHVMLYEPNEGWLFTGDMYVAPKQKIAFKDEHIGETIKSLEATLTLDFDTMFCAHAGVKQNAKQLISDKLDYFYEIRHQVLAMRNKGMSDRKIANMLFPKKRAITYYSFGEWSAYNLVKTM